MPMPTEGVFEHPAWCVPRECLAGSPDQHQRHRSAPAGFRLQDDACGTRLIARVTESVVAPRRLFLEVDVYPDDADEPHHELRIAFTDLLGVARFSLGIMADAVAHEAGPIEHFNAAA
ncbi:hypothetical protein ACIA8K_14270 [Catenuloplanes sp. NPDC051500]|uniref:hypothetical protein n=1 Tax=Catenuloplanes sp. NPDC051500 TaxID=3363959 RepID=UPI0037A1DE8A